MLGLLAPLATGMKELVAMAPEILSNEYLQEDIIEKKYTIAEGRPLQNYSAFQWIQLEYDEKMTSASEVSMRVAPDNAATRKALGAWYDYDLVTDTPRGVGAYANYSVGGLHVTARVQGSLMVSLAGCGATAKSTTGEHRAKSRKAATRGASTLQARDDAAADADPYYWSGIGAPWDDSFFVPYQNRSCSTVRITPYSGEAEVRVELIKLLRSVFPSYVEAQHTLAVTTLPGGRRAALVIVYYHEPTYSNRSALDAIVAVDLDTHELIPDADGNFAYKPYERIGSIVGGASMPKDYRIQYPTCLASNTECDRNWGLLDFTAAAKETSFAVAATWHGNGIMRFESEGTQYITLTYYTQNEALVIQCPWARASAAGGGTIVQRFGNPWIFDAGYYDGSKAWDIGLWETKTVISNSEVKWYGIKEADGPPIRGLHNVFFTPSSPTSAFKGQPTLTILVNNRYDTPYESYVYEFAFRPQPLATPTVDNWATTYVSKKTPFYIEIHGGARPIGDGVYAVMGGSSANFTVIDLSPETNFRTIGYRGLPTGGVWCYDPFIRVGLDS